MSRLKKVEYEVGEDAYGRVVTLIKELQSNGELAWEIQVDGAKQGDDDQTIRGLTSDVIAEMAKVAAQR